MATRKPTSSAPAAESPAGGARTAYTQADATKIGLFGVEVDATNDREYTAVGQTAKPKPKTTAKETKP